MKVIAISGWKRSGKDTAAEHLIKEYGFKRIAFADPLKDRVAEEFEIPRSHCDDPAFKEAPILHLPVLPKDAFSLTLSKFMAREFRSADGRTPMELVEDGSGGVLGLMSYRSVFGAPDATQVYWTPRALCILKGSSNRTVRSDYWVKAAIDKAKNMAKPNKDLESIYGEGYGVYENFVISDLRYKSELTQMKQAFGKDLVTVRVNRFDTCESQDPSERDLDNASFDVVLDNKGTLEEFIAKVEELIKE